MIYTVNDLASTTMEHKFGDMFNLPGLTNFLGCVQVDMDLTGIRSVNFPPFGCSDVITGGLFLDNRYFPTLKIPVKFTWYPDRIVREADYNGFNIKTITSLVVKKRATVVKIEIENKSAAVRELKLKMVFRGTVTKTIDKWYNFLPPYESDNKVEIDQNRKSLMYKAQHSQAFLMQGLFPHCDDINEYGVETSLKLVAGEKKELFYINAIDDTVGDVRNLYDSIAMNGNKTIQESRDDWNEEIKAIFTPGNSRYSGHLPTLETDDEEILRLYYMSIISVIYFKRDNPYSVYGRAYDTLVPKYWQSITFIWDYSLSSLIHSMLDPKVTKKYLELWMHKDIHQHYGTEFLTGKAVGPWYSANDYSLLMIANNYLNWNDDLEWLNKQITGSNKNDQNLKVIDYFEKYAKAWKLFETKDGLADYGGINNLLECVSSYIHQVASLNAGNVFAMRLVANLFDILGEKSRSSELKREAEIMLKNLGKLYVDGKGFWNARMEDGKLIEVRHCYDFLTVTNTIQNDLSEKQKQEMADFVINELKSDTWIRGLSPEDNDAIYSVRPDHQWNGGYPAWPCFSIKGLYNIGKPDEAFEWLKGVAKSVNQGPFGQAHFVESAIDPENGGAKKCPSEPPYMTDWAVSGGGGFFNVILESIFGIRISLKDGISANPQFSSFDPKAKLYNIQYQGKLYMADKNGIHEQE